MPTTTSALAGLVPLVGAVALMVQGTRRMFLRSRDARPASAAVPQPIEIAPPPARIARKPRDLPDIACPGCGTSMPATETLCAACDVQSAAAGVTRELVGHWLLFFVVLAGIIGGGWLALH